MPQISIIIPVYNAESFLDETLGSVLHQTMADIEAICVDDCSTDASFSILERYADKDARIKLIRFDTNQSAAQARKSGVMAATGEYILFLDGDDTLTEHACENLYRIMRAKQPDILHFGTKVVGIDSLPKQRVDAVQRMVAPYNGYLQGDEVLSGCFRSRKYEFTLWNKMYKAELCKKAFARVREGKFEKAQDLYAFFLLAYYAKSYWGVPNETYYTYQFGRGVTGQPVLDLARFERYCTQSKVAQAIRIFLEEEQAFDAYADIYQSIHQRLLMECVTSWCEHLVSRDSAAGFDLLVKYWGSGSAVGALANKYWYRRSVIADKLAGANALAHTKDKLATIGTYYHHINIGGVQRVIANLIPIWQRFGYKVVLFIDEEPGDNDYTLPDNVARVVLPPYNIQGNDKGTLRIQTWERELAQNNVDLMVYHAWASPHMLWDMCAVKVMGIPFVIQTHSIFSFFMMKLQPAYAEMPHTFSLCDAVVSLSQVDALYWHHCCGQAYYIPNPLTFDLREVRPVDGRGRNILWIARFSDEKNPYQALQIMNTVRQSVPDAKLWMVGSAAASDVIKRLQSKINSMKLAENIILIDSPQDVAAYYGQSSLMLVTSSYEGFLLTLAEGKSYGLPCVMYELPYLELTRDGKGFVAVKQQDSKAAAQAVIDLLLDEEKRLAMGKEARESIEQFAAFDIASAWKAVFDNAVRPKTEAAREFDKTLQTLLATIAYHYGVGCARKNPVLQPLSPGGPVLRVLRYMWRKWNAFLRHLRVLGPKKTFSIIWKKVVNKMKKEK